MKFFRVSDTDGQFHAVTVVDDEPLCRRLVTLLFPENLSGAFSASHQSACPECVTAMEALRGDPAESYVDDYTDEVVDTPDEVPPAEPDDDAPPGTPADTPANT